MTQQNFQSDPFHLTNRDPNVTEADGTANAFSDIWKYQVPIGTQLVLMPSHTFSAYIEDTSPAEVGNATARLRIEVRDPAEEEKRVILGPTLYLNVKEFQDRTLMQRLMIPSPVTIKERQWIVITVRDDGTIDASDSYFDLHIARVRALLPA